VEFDRARGEVQQSKGGGVLRGTILNVEGQSQTQREPNQQLSASFGGVVRLSGSGDFRDSHYYPDVAFRMRVHH